MKLIKGSETVDCIKIDEAFMCIVIWCFTDVFKSCDYDYVCHLLLSKMIISLVFMIFVHIMSCTRLFAMTKIVLALASLVSCYWVLCSVIH